MLLALYVSHLFRSCALKWLCIQAFWNTLLSRAAAVNTHLPHTVPMDQDVSL